MNIVRVSNRKQITTQKTQDEWTFLDVSTRNYTHAIHLYPARMHPEIAKRVIEKYATKKTVAFDPFMGSGGVLLEAIIHGNNAIGIDLNPFAVLLSKVKTTPIRKNLVLEMKEVLNRTNNDLRHGLKHKAVLPESYNLEDWFDAKTLQILAILKHSINSIKDSNMRDFFKICLSLTVRKSSYQRNSAWKIHRMSNDDRIRFAPKPIDIFRIIANDNIRKMSKLVKAGPTGTAYPILGDSRDIALGFKKLGSILNDKKVNLMITSPPYGDHKTTVAYGQFSRHSSHWLDLPDEQILHVDKDGLGGRIYADMDDLGSGTLNKTLDQIHKNDLILTKNKTPCRDKEAYAFFMDLDACMNQVSQNMIHGNSHACFVVANRTVRRVVVPTDQILIELGKKYGFSVKEIIYRDIPNKAMPSKNAPENITNDAGSTMTRETIIITEC